MCSDFNIVGIDWGNDSAENDTDLLNYFVTPDHFSRIREFKKSFIIGRKGSGKTAIRKKLLNELSQETNHFVIELSPTNSIFRNIAGVELIKEDRSDEVIFEYSWLHNIMRKLLNKVGSSGGNNLATNSWETARLFARQEGVTNLDYIESLTKLLNSLKIKIKDVGDLGIQMENIIKESSGIDQYEYHLVNLAKEGCKFTVLIDDLDMGWDNSDKSNDVLLGLLTDSFYLKALDSNIKVILFIRDDIYSILMKKTTHSDKYRDVFRITWEQDTLRNLLAKRIAHSNSECKNLTNEDLFLKVFPEKIGNQFTINWMTERTLGRPRELLQLSRLYTESLKANIASDQTLKDVENVYSSWKKDDLCSEFVNQYPKLERIFEFWKSSYHRTKYHLDRNELEIRMSSILQNVTIQDVWFSELQQSKNIKELARILFNIGFLGDFIKGGDGGSKVYYFGDTEEPLLNEVQVHPCFRKAVGTVERNRTPGIKDEISSDFQNFDFDMTT